MPVSACSLSALQLVSQELIRIAILWHEMWHEALEEASRLYFGESNVEAMLGVLLPLHELMEKTGPSTLKEIAFVQVILLCALIATGAGSLTETACIL
jgi:FKBP12-rapamycin complex-associated protein